MAINTVDELVFQSAFGEENDQQQARWQIWQKAIDRNIIPASINALYLAFGQDKISERFAVPAMNLRGMSYDLAQTIFLIAKKHRVGALIFELARSEMGYTNQPPQEYVITVMAAALKQNWSGPLFIQGDHFQTKEISPGIPKAGEIEAVKQLINDSIAAGIYNIDIDTSTLVDLDQLTEVDQQVPNIQHSLDLAHYVRGIEPEGIEVSLGGEIGHIGGKNSTVADFRAYMNGFNNGLNDSLLGLSKISVQTGSSHGGVVLADGTLADVDVDFSILKNISDVGRKEFKIGGTVQHGASTLPDKYFNQFVQAEAIEVHLATGFQNLQMDHPAFPKELLASIYKWLDENKADEKKLNMTDEQFHYKLRKKAWGQFKQRTWEIPKKNRSEIQKTLSDRFEFLFKELNVFDTVEVVNRYIKPVVIAKTVDDFRLVTKVREEKGLAD